METKTGPDEETLYVDTEDAERGAEGPFFVVYRTPDRERRWGYFCGNCDSFRTAMDSMGRIKCNDCGNLKKPDEWDAAHE
ncbi:MULTISPECIES: DUF5816 domain-containing protein [Halosimplex]|uniref:GNAT family acetyltransferase n=1 Tax=Halosimplex carlsbadense 2-9-1 TaxID=797114 RepID=M0CJH5_9EURY|nr:DUF5816 domain-containing protein [Halosimplex carlsbadense]ELZ23445.1 hypothetical protein C475_14268 [Halosimplex carlsbadense 2-9-1]